MDRWRKVLGKAGRNEIKDSDERIRLERSKKLFP